MHQFISKSQQTPMKLLFTSPLATNRCRNALTCSFLSRSLTSSPTQLKQPQPLLRLCYSTASKGNPAPKPSRVNNHELKQQAKAAANSTKSFEIAERILIYHAGTGRITFLAMLKVTSLFIGAFFCFIAVPSYIKSDKPASDSAGVLLCGIIPLLFIAYTTAPFVTHIHIHLPPQARTSRAVLERFVRSVPSSTQLTLTTMSFIAKPRYSSVLAGDLFPVRRRLGLVNLARGTHTENKSRKWYMYRAVGEFYVQERQQQQQQQRQPDHKAPTTRPRYQKKKKDLVEGWIWETIKDKLQGRALNAQ